MNQILVIDDNKELCNALAEFLRSTGFEVETVNNPLEGLQRALSEKNHLTIIGTMPRKMAGLTLLRSIRASSQNPVLMLTAQGDTDEQILALEMGADDALLKPYNPRELVARIHTVLRRAQPMVSQNDKRFSPFKQDDIILDISLKTVKANTHEIKVTAIECSLLYQLLKKAGQVISREELSQKVLHRKLDLFDRSIDVHVSSLRKKLRFACNSFERIKTIRGVGYCYTHCDQNNSYCH